MKDKSGCKKISSLLNKKSAINHLSRVKGQIEGIIKMIEKDDYCVDIMNQCRAIRGGVYRVEEQLLEAHLKACVVQAIRSEDERDSEEVIREILDMYKISPNGKPGK